MFATYTAAGHESKTFRTNLSSLESTTRTAVSSCRALPDALWNSDDTIGMHHCDANIGRFVVPTAGRVIICFLFAAGKCR